MTQQAYFRKSLKSVRLRVVWDFLFVSNSPAHGIAASRYRGWRHRTNHSRRILLYLNLKIFTHVETPKPLSRRMIKKKRQNKERRNKKDKRGQKHTTQRESEGKTRKKKQPLVTALISTGAASRVCVCVYVYLYIYHYRALWRCA